jgi:hypothetical protein
MCYAEEAELLLEEMRQVLAFLEWDRDRWKKCEDIVGCRCDLFGEEYGIGIGHTRFLCRQSS